ncbi:MAG: helix-turn-helix domain-containing protein, partial [Myxococcota bacterium]
SMPGTRRYHLLCPIARGLDRLGDRWTLLVLRDLHAGPARFTDLQVALPGLAPNLLTRRLRQLEEDGLIRRRDAEFGVSLYELTPLGQGTAPLLFELSAFGGQFVPDDDIQSPGNVRTIAVTLQVACQRAASRDLDLRARLDVSGESFSLIVDGGEVDVKAGSLVDPQVTVTTQYEALVAVNDGRMPLDRFLSSHAKIDAADPQDLAAFMGLMAGALQQLAR